MLMTDSVVAAVQPGFQVGEDEMDDRQMLFGNLRIAALRDRDMFIAASGKVGVAAPVVGNDNGSWHNGFLNEAAQGSRATIRHNGKPDTASISAALPCIEFCAGLALADLYGTGDQNFVMDATALATGPSTHIGFVDFDRLPDLPTQSILIRANHASAELVENLERSLVASQPKLPLKLHSRQAGRLTGHQGGSPKPYVQRRMRKFHHRSSRQPGIAHALAATKSTGAIGKPLWFAIHSAVRADKSVAPSSFLQVSRAGRIVGKEPLELRQRLPKRQAVALINIHEHGPIIIPSAALGDNRIGVL